MFGHLTYERVLFWLCSTAIAFSACLSLWITHGRAAWPWRIALFLLIIAGLLQIVAPDLAIYMSAQTLACWVLANAWGAATKTWRRQWRRPQFTLKTLLLAWVAASVGAAELAIIINTPQRFRLDWFLIGAAAGGLSSILYWVSTRTRFGVRLMIAMIAVLPAYAALFGYVGANDLLVVLVQMPKLPTMSANSFCRMLSLASTAMIVAHYLLLRWADWHDLLYISAAKGVDARPPNNLRIVAWLRHGYEWLLPTVSQLPAALARSRRLVMIRRWLSRAAWLSLLLFVAAPLAQIARHWPADILPPSPRTDPNALDEIDALIPTINWTSIPQQDYGSATNEEFATFVNDNADLPEKIRSLLRQPCYVVVDYSYESQLSLRATARREIGRAMQALSLAAQARGDAQAAANYAIDAVRLGASIWEDGLLVDGLVGAAISNVGLARLYSVRSAFPDERFETLIEQLGTLDRKWDHWPELHRRDMAWEQQHYRWQTKLSRAIKSALDIEDGDYSLALCPYLAMLRMLRLEIAIDLYRADHGVEPNTLADLAPQYIESVPLDPFSGEPFIYRLADEGHVLYSVGQNRIDDGGQFDPETQNDKDLPPNMYEIANAYWKQKEAKDAAVQAAEAARLEAETRAFAEPDESIDDPAPAKDTDATEAATEAASPPAQ